jgi:hypothetical protein
MKPYSSSAATIVSVTPIANDFVWSDSQPLKVSFDRSYWRSRYRPL